ncbi:MAG: ATP-binding cassette domain-containing protein [Pseudolabrys sp.]|jgi:branched-chain amino acid transport system ATP-binding protein
MLDVAGLEVEIQNSEILRGVSFNVSAGELVCLVGRNGAGKTTTLRTIMGYLPPRSGVIRLADIDLAGKSTLERARLGIGYSPEDSEVFGELTVAENIELPTWTRATGKSADERIALAYQVFPNLRRYESRPGTHLSGGERKMLSIARALSLDADLLLLDEPFEGLSPAIIPAIRDSIHEIVKLGRTVLIAESELQHVPDYANRIYVMERGELVFGGTLEKARHDATVRRIIGETL